MLSSMYFRLDVGEFLGVGNDTDGPNLLRLHFNRQDAKGFRPSTHNERRLTIDFGEFHPRASVVMIGSGSQGPTYISRLRRANCS